MGEWEIRSVSGILPDSPGVLKKLNRYHFRVPFISTYTCIVPIKRTKIKINKRFALSGWLIFFSRDGKPYCEKDYQTEFGVTCSGCGGYIIGKVLQVNKLQLITLLFCFFILKTFLYK